MSVNQLDQQSNASIPSSPQPILGGERPMSKRLEGKIVGFAASDSSLVPRSSHNLAVTVELLSDVECEKATLTLAQEMGISSEGVFEDATNLAKVITGKAITLEASANHVHNAAGRTAAKLSKAMALLSAEGAALNQKLILSIYSNITALSTEEKNIVNLSESLEQLRVQLNMSLGIPEEKVALSRMSQSPSGFGLRESLIGGSPSESHKSSLPPPTQTPGGIKLFAKLPKQIVESGLEKPELMRLSAVYELIETEVDYVKDLQTMINFHRVQIKETCGEADANLIFSNIDQLLAANQALEAKMNIKREANIFISEVGDLLIDCAESFSVYATYASNYPSAMKLVHSYANRPELKEAMARWVAAPEGRGLSLESFLIKPIQRLCKYPLLIRDLERYCDKAGNVKDKELLKLAAEKIEKAVTAVNEATRAAEEKQRILNLGSSIETPEPLQLEDKVYLKDGVIQRISKSGKTKDRYIILYTDLLLICEPIIRDPPVRGPTKYTLECGYSLAELTLSNNAKDSVKNIKSSNIIGLNVISGDKDTILLVTNTPEDCVKWLDAFQNALKDITEEHRSAVRSMQAQQRSVDRQSSMPSMDMFGSVRGKAKSAKSSGLSSIASKRAQTRKSTVDWNNASATELVEPEAVKIAGVVYKRAISAIGLPYYFSIQDKKSIWKLPTDYLYLDEEEPVPGQQTTSPQTTEDLSPPTGQATNTSPLQLPPNSNSATSEAEDDLVALDVVEAFPNWRKVDRGEEPPYYFHIITQETRWEIPTSN